MRSPSPFLPSPPYMRITLRSLLVVSVAVAPVATPTGGAQQPAAAPAKAAAAPAPQLDFSGVIFGNYLYGGAQTNTGARTNNQFSVDRSYLTFRMPAGDNLAIRVTADLFQQSNQNNGFYNGWALRLKYAYLQANYLDNRDLGVKGAARIGMVELPMVGFQEGIWPRFLGQVPIDRYGYQGSADVGVMTVISLPNKLGEFQGDITNGPGYQAAENDRFKDFSTRLTLTPFASSTGPALFKSLALTGWAVAGTGASRYVNGVAATGANPGVAPVGTGLDHSRAGASISIAHPALSAMAEYHVRNDESENANAATTGNVTVTQTKGNIISAFGLLRPFKAMDSLADYQSLGLLLRWDRVTSNQDLTPQPQGQFVVAGLLYDLSKRVTVALDYQEQTLSNNINFGPFISTPPTPTGGAVPSIYSPGDTRTFYVHFQASF
ncbi:MAG: hypothetical protein NVS9B3_02820 [Gemmatimonadaceae bacterium]